MREYTVVLMIAVALAACSASANTIVVDPAGGGDYDNIPEAAFHAAADDTVLVLPGTYAVTAAGAYPWPIPLDGTTPTIMSESGAAVTTLDGDGATATFSVAAGVTDSRLSVHGFTFSHVPEIIDWDYPSYPGGAVRFTDNVVAGSTLNAGYGAGRFIARNTFTGSGGTAIALAAYGDLDGLVEDNEVSGYGCGIGAGGENVEVRGNHIHDCVDTGIYGVEPLTAIGNVIENNGGHGITLEGNYYLEGNVIRGHDVGIGWPWEPIGGLQGYARLNDIYDNSTSIRTPEIMFAWEFDATTNWWGTVDPEEIAAGIHDCNDPPWGGAGCVVFDPWCTAPIPGCDPTGVAETLSWGTIKALYR